MLFDLRSRGRRRTVQAVYLGLAVLMGGGLILFGAGTGSGFRGLLNAFTGTGSNNHTAQISQAEKAAINQTQKAPSNAAAETRTGDLAAAKVYTMVPKASRKSILQQIDTAKTNPALAQTC